MNTSSRPPSGALKRPLPSRHQEKKKKIHIPRNIAHLQEIMASLKRGDLVGVSRPLLVGI